jgi:hypothetical protein
MRALVVLCVIAGGADAQPGGSTCIPPDTKLYLRVRDGNAIACAYASGTCWAVEQGGSTVKRVREPAALPDDAPITTTRKDGGKLAVCLGTTCKKVGTTVASAIASLRNELTSSRPGEQPRQVLHLTADHKVVVVDGKAYALATDQPLALEPPVEFTKLRTPPVKTPLLVQVAGIGNVLIAIWAPCKAASIGSRCDDDTPMSVAVDTSGKTQSAWFPTGPAIQLDADRLVVIGYAQSQVTSLSAPTGKLIGAYTMSDGNIGAEAAKVDAGTLAVLTTAGGYDVHWVSVPKDQVPVRRSRQPIPACPRAKQP